MYNTGRTVGMTGMTMKAAIDESARRFPATIWSLVLKLSSPERRHDALDRLFRLYHAPILAHLQRSWPRKSFEAVEDLAGGFFCYLLEKADFSKYDPSRARFRTFLKVMLNGYARDVHDHETSQKQGGALRRIPFEGDRARLVQTLADHRTLGPEEILDAVVRDELLRQALANLKKWAEATGRADQHRAFEAYALDADGDRSHQDVARALGINEQQARNHVFGMRERLRHELRELIKPGLEDPDRDLDEEYREILGSP